MKRRILFFISTLFLVGSINASFAKNPAQTVHSPQIEIKKFSKQTAKPKRKINMQYSLLTSDQSSATDLNALIHQTLHQKVDDFLKSSSKEIENFESSLEINDSVLFYKPEKLISIQYEQFTYLAGSAHPNTTHFVINYDLVTKKELLLEDILKDPQSDLEFIANYAIKILKTKNLGTTNFIEEGAAPKFKNYQDWNFTDKGLLIVFDPYQVAAYVYGPQKIMIPYSKLEGHIKSKYYQLLQ